MPQAELLQRFAELWDLCKDLPESTLLRLAVLRDLVRSLHAERSRLLATGRRPEAQAYRVWEGRLNALRTTFPLEGDLPHLLESDEPIRKRTRLLPEALLATVGKEKLERYDRLWESAIAAEASAQGWNFWQLTASVEVPHLEAWDRRLAERLWPQGVVLFFESLEEPPTESSSTSYWPGRWLVAVHPHYPSPEALSLDLEHWTGTHRAPSRRPEWKHLFTPRQS